MDVAHYLLTASFLPFLVGLPGYAIGTPLGLRGLARTVYAPGVTIVIVGTLTAATIPLSISFTAASWIIVAVLVAAGGAATLVALRRQGGAALAPLDDERLACLLVLATFAFLAGFNLMTSNPPGSINPCAPVTSPQKAYSPVQTGGACAVVAPPGLTMSRIPERAQDDFLQFRTAQAIWNRHLYDDRDYSGGWRLQDRTPLLGLVTAGLAGTSGRSLPVTFPPQPSFPQFGPTPLWLKRFGAPHDSSIRPKTQPSAFARPGYQPPLVDRWDYWFYRLVAIFLNTLIILPTFALGARLGGKRVGALAAIAAGFSPAIMQNAYYTSPKYLGVYFGLCGLLLVVERRPAASGVSLGASFMAHPLGAVLAAPIVVYEILRRRLRRAAVLIAAGAITAVPWFVFTAETGRSSTLAAYPLGCVGPTVTISSCWHDFVKRPVSRIVWQRAEIVPELLVPASLTPEKPLTPESRDGLILKWLTAHDFAFPGMVGFVFFVFAVLGFVRLWPREKLLLATIVGGQLVMIVLIWGLQTWPAWVVGLGILPFLYVAGAFGLTSVGRRTATVGAVVIGIEWVIYLFALYRPIRSVGVGQYVFGWTLVAGALVWLARTAWLMLAPSEPWAEIRSAPRGAETTS